MALLEGILDIQTLPLGTAIAVGGPAVALGGLSLWLFKAYVNDHQRRRSSNLPPVPEVPGIPVIGNLLQLKEKKPHKTFAKWAETYGPIYSIKTGANKMVVLNSNEIAKEAMVTRYAFISSRKLSNALKILTADKSIVAMSDYDEFYKAAKRHILTSALGSNAQVFAPIFIVLFTNHLFAYTILISILISETTSPPQRCIVGEYY